MCKTLVYELGLNANVISQPAGRVFVIGHNWTYIYKNHTKAT